MYHNVPVYDFAIKKKLYSQVLAVVSLGPDRNKYCIYLRLRNIFLLSKVHIFGGFGGLIWITPWWKTAGDGGETIWIWELGHTVPTRRRCLQCRHVEQNPSNLLPAFFLFSPFFPFIFSFRRTTFSFSFWASAPGGCRPTVSRRIFLFTHIPSTKRTFEYY